MSIVTCIIIIYYRSSMRTVNLFDIGTSSPLSEVTINISPATLVPYFDVDTKLLFLSGKVLSYKTVVV